MQASHWIIPFNQQVQMETKVKGRQSFSLLSTAGCPHSWTPECQDTKSLAGFFFFESAVQSHTTGFLLIPVLLAWPVWY